MIQFKSKKEKGKRKILKKDIFKRLNNYGSKVTI